MSSKKKNKNTSKIISIFFIPLFTCWIGYSVVMMLLSGETSICRRVAPVEPCFFTLSDSPEFYWMVMFVWFLILGMFIYVSIMCVKNR
jgi:hypothetical protein